jgi:hypothetical protein
MTIAVAALACALGLLFLETAGAADNVPASAVQPVLSWQAALNAHDVERSVSVFTDDAVVIQPRVGGLPQVFVGREEITWWLRNLVAQGVQVEVYHEPVVDRGRATWVGTLSVDAYRGLGVEAAETVSEAVLRGGQISSLTTVLTVEGAKQLHAAPLASVTSVSTASSAGPSSESTQSMALVVSTLASATGGFGIGLLLGRRVRRVGASAASVRSNPLRV